MFEEVLQFSNAVAGQLVVSSPRSTEITRLQTRHQSKRAKARLVNDEGLFYERIDTDSHCRDLLKWLADTVSPAVVEIIVIYPAGYSTPSFIVFGRFSSENSAFLSWSLLYISFSISTEIEKTGEVSSHFDGMLVAVQILFDSNANCGASDLAWFGTNIE